MKTSFFVAGLLVITVLHGCQTTPQKTNRDPLINEALTKASISASRGALVAEVSQSTRRILSQPFHYGVTLSGRVSELLSRDWVGKPIAVFELEAKRFVSGPVQEFGYPQAGKIVLIFSN